MAEPPTASVRRRVWVPLRFADGYATTAQVVTFDGLVGGGAHLALGLGRWVGRGAPLVRPHSECLTGDVFGMLAALGVDRVRLLTNNPDKITQLEKLGVTVTEQVPTGQYRGPANAAYLAAKAHHFTRSPVR